MSSTPRDIAAVAEEELGKEPFTEWQVLRLRNALRTYHLRIHHDGEQYSWRDVSEAIAEETEVVIPPERIRQFVEGVRQKDGSFKFPVPQDNRMQAIKTFVLSSDNDLLDDALYHATANDLDIAVTLLEYAQRDNLGLSKVPAGSFAGVYEGGVSKYASEGGHLISEKQTRLRLYEPLGASILKASFVESFHWDFPEQGDADELKKRPASKSQIHCQGFAVITPENQLDLYLKRIRNGQNSRYICVNMRIIERPEMQVVGLDMAGKDIEIFYADNLNDHKVFGQLEEADLYRSDGLSRLRKLGGFEQRMTWKIRSKRS